jgi:hypothetical protein
MPVKIDLDPKKKAVLISVAILLFTFFVCFNIASAHAKKRELIKRRVSDISKRIVLRQDIEKIDKIKQEYSLRKTS